MLKLQGVSYSAKRGSKVFPILKGISLTIKSGELTVITGANGSGKTTLAKIIAGITPATEGRIILDGKDISKLDCSNRARAGIAYSFQQPVYFKGITVRDLLQIAASGSEAFLADNPPKVEKFLKTVGLNPPEYLDREIDNSLSGGELKRIEIASAIARKAKLYIFDEPEAGIDLWSFDNLVKIFKDMRKNDPHCSIIIISHQDRIIKLADKIVFLKNGRIEALRSERKVTKKAEAKK